MNCCAVVVDVTGPHVAWSTRIEASYRPKVAASASCSTAYEQIIDESDVCCEMTIRLAAVVSRRAAVDAHCGSTTEVADELVALNQVVLNGCEVTVPCDHS